LIGVVVSWSGCRRGARVRLDDGRVLVVDCDAMLVGTLGGLVTAREHDRVVVLAVSDNDVVTSCRPEAWKTQAEAEAFKSRNTEFLDARGNRVAIDRGDKPARRKGRHQNHHN
jgi:hypothetical protein